MFLLLAEWPFSNHNIITLLQTNCPAEVKEASKTICQKVEVLLIFAALAVGSTQQEPYPAYQRAEMSLLRTI